MHIDDIKRRVDELIRKAGQVLQTTHQTNHGGTRVSDEIFNEFKSASLSFLKNTFGVDHPYYKEFETHMLNVAYPHAVEQGRGILTAVKEEIDNGWIFTVKGLVSAEIFADFLEMGEYLLNQDYKDPAAVVIGSVLEEHLRQLCLKNNIKTSEPDKNGKEIPKKADSLNSELAKNNVYNLLDQKSVTAWLDLRNKAAHGKYGEYSKEQVEILLTSVMSFMTRFPI